AHTPAGPTCPFLSLAYGGYKSPRVQLCPWCVDCCRCPGCLGQGAPEILGLITAARPAIQGDLRIGTERPRPIDDPPREVRRDDLRRRAPLFDPLLERHPGRTGGDRGPLPAPAVRHPRRQEQAKELGRPVVIPELHHDALIVVDSVRGGDELVVPAVVTDELATARLEGAEVRVRRVEHELPLGVLEGRI